MAASWTAFARRSACGRTRWAGTDSLLLPPLEEPTPSERRSHLMERRRNAARRRRNRLAFVAGAVLVLAAVALAVVFAGRNSTAPAVVGRTLDQARSMVEASGLKTEVAQEIPDDSKDPGTVISQEPQAGEHPADGIVRVTVAREPIPVKVTSVKDNDPEGNNKENPDQVARVIDGKEDVSWATESYDTAAFAGIKKGVGLVFQVGGARQHRGSGLPRRGLEGRTPGGRRRRHVHEGRRTQGSPSPDLDADSTHQERPHLDHRPCRRLGRPLLGPSGRDQLLALILPGAAADPTWPAAAP